MMKRTCSGLCLVLRWQRTRHTWRRTAATDRFAREWNGSPPSCCRRYTEERHGSRTHRGNQAAPDGRQTTAHKTKQHRTKPNNAENKQRFVCAADCLQHAVSVWNILWQPGTVSMDADTLPKIAVYCVARAMRTCDLASNVSSLPVGGARQECPPPRPR